MLDDSIEDYKKDKEKFGKFAQFDSHIPIILDGITEELAHRLHPLISRQKTDDETQTYKLQLRADYTGDLDRTTNHEFGGNLKDARQRLGELVSSASLDARCAGVQGLGFNDHGKMI